MLGAASVGPNSRSYVELREKEDESNSSSKKVKLNYKGIHPSQIRGINRHRGGKKK